MTSNRHVATVYATARGLNSRGSTLQDTLISESWRRCVSEYELDPSRISESVLTQAELTTRRQQLGEVVNIARDEMRNLAAQIAGAGYALLLTDADGFILCHQSERSRQDAFRSAGLWDGANWSETCQGTNGIGTALIERAAVTVHCNDHFATRNTNLSCSAVPILAPNGSLLGVMDASSVQCEDSRASQAHTVALVRMTVQVIEKRLFMNTWKTQRILRFHSRPEYVNLLQDGMVAIDNQDRILAADNSAAIQLGFDDRTTLIGKTIADVFDVSTGFPGFGSPPGRVCVVREIRRGRRYFACLQMPDYSSVPIRTSVAQTNRTQRISIDALGGKDKRMRENVRCVYRVIDKDIRIMLQGETGTGKEAFARAIHNASRRSDKPFIAINCAALPETLIESELFGYAPGAFTGARREGMRGMIERASGGTLFLDEIGDMPLALQTRLLRVLEECEVVPLGSAKAIEVDLNLISATHAPLQTLVAEGSFRADLYYRLNGISLTLPPIRERSDKRFLLYRIVAAEQKGHLSVQFEKAALDLLLAYDWPGNIRQMRSVVRTALALSDDGHITQACLPTEITEAGRERIGRLESIEDSALTRAEGDALSDVLFDHAGNVSACARHLGISRNTLYRKLRRHQLNIASYRGPVAVDSATSATSLSTQAGSR